MESGVMNGALWGLAMRTSRALPYGAGVIAALLFAGACTQQDGEGEEVVRTSAAALSEAQGDTPEVVVKDLPSKDVIARAVPVVEVLRPDLEAVKAHPVATVSLATLSEDAHARLTQAPLPVIYPSALTATQWREQVKVTVGEHWYALSMQDGELNVYMQGTRTRFEHPSLELDARGESLLKDAPYVVSRTHGILTLSFERFGGLGYHIDVECKRHAQDERCASEAFIVSLYESLVRMPARDDAPQGGAR